MKRALAVGVVAVPLLLFSAALTQVLVQAHPFDALGGMTKWFDPLLIVYDALLLLFGVLFVPLIATSYLVCMKDEKELRLRRELGPLWPANEQRVKAYVAAQFRVRDYFVPVAAMMIIVAFGGAIVLLLHPVWGASGGLDFKRGASLLLVGPRIEGFLSDETFHVISHSLTAFAFGFLGAYIYSITQLVRGYFTTDLNAGAFVASSTRIAMACALAVILAFSLSALVIEPGAKTSTLATFLGTFRPSHETATALLPLITFFFGYFPNTALRAVERITSRTLTWIVKDESWGATSLNKISGMNINHAFRMEREGFDNAENLACADPIELAMRTGFPYAQVQSWIDEARLLIHLGDDDFRAFTAGTGIRTYDQLLAFVHRWNRKDGSWSEHLAKAAGKDIAAKLDAVVRIAGVVDLPPESDAPPKPVMVPIRGDASVTIQAS
jgi:hypothetical protein